jgi:hypothetical protein
MHPVTSSIFLPPPATLHPPSSQVLPLRSYFPVSRAHWVSRDRLFDILRNYHRLNCTRASAHVSRTRPIDPGCMDNSQLIMLMHPGENLCKMRCTFEPFASLREKRSAISDYTVILSRRSCAVVICLIGGLHI